MSFGLAALQLQPPTFNPAGMLQAATQIEGARTQNQMVQLRMQELGEQMRESRERRGALEQFGRDGGLGNYNALSALSRFPDIYTQALSAMSARDQAHATRNARGAERVRGLMNDQGEWTSQDGPRVWQDELRTALQEGRITQAQYTALARHERPPMLVLQNIIAQAQARPTEQEAAHAELYRAQAQDLRIRQGQRQHTFESLGLAPPSGARPPAPGVTAPPAGAVVAPPGQVAPPATGAAGFDLNRAADSIAAIESAGRGDYNAIGPATRRADGSIDRPIGRYQVMESNIPEWTQRHLGRRMTAQEFLASPEAQDRVFHGQFGSYTDRFGNLQDAASMWFTGRPAGADRRDVLGTTGSDYVNRFMARYTGGQPPGAAPPADRRTLEDAASAMLRDGGVGGGPGLESGLGAPGMSVSDISRALPAPVRLPMPGAAIPPATGQSVGGFPLATPPGTVSSGLPGTSLAPPAGTPPPGAAAAPGTTPPGQPPPAQRQRNIQDLMRQATPAERARLTILLNDNKSEEVAKLLNEIERRVGISDHLSGGLDELARLPDRYGGNRGVFTSAIGTFQGPEPGSLLNPVSHLQHLARAWGSISSTWPLARGEGAGASPTAVRSEIAAGRQALVRALMPLIRPPGSGEGTLSNTDQERIDAIIGDLASANDVASYRTALDRARGRINETFGLNLPPIEHADPTRQHLDDARAALRSGANRTEIQQRLRELGIDPARL